MAQIIDKATLLSIAAIIIAVPSIPIGITSITPICQAQPNILICPLIANILPPINQHKPVKFQSSMPIIDMGTKPVKFQSSNVHDR
jgi:hypothetical protein